MQNPKFKEYEPEPNDEDEEWFDANGNQDPNGCYDAGGHVDGERLACRYENIYDLLTER